MMKETEHDNRSRENHNFFLFVDLIIMLYQLTTRDTMGHKTAFRVEALVGPHNEECRVKN